MVMFLYAYMLQFPGAGIIMRPRLVSTDPSGRLLPSPPRPALAAAPLEPLSLPLRPAPVGP